MAFKHLCSPSECRVHQIKSISQKQLSNQKKFGIFFLENSVFKIPYFKNLLCIAFHSRLQSSRREFD